MERTTQAATATAATTIITIATGDTGELTPISLISSKLFIIQLPFNYFLRFASTTTIPIIAPRITTPAAIRITISEPFCEAELACAVG